MPLALPVVQAVIPADVMLPERRLEELVEQALLAQVAACRYHNTPGIRPSLLRDYACGTEQIPTCTTQAGARHPGWHCALNCRGQFPACLLGRRLRTPTHLTRTHQHRPQLPGTCVPRSLVQVVRRRAVLTRLPRPIHHHYHPTTAQVLLDHTDEVWHLQFSHDGAMLASCGKDQTAILWEVQRSGGCRGGRGGGAGGGGGGGEAAAAGALRVGSTVVKRHVLRGHHGPIAFLCWSPDDSKLATCGASRAGVHKGRFCAQS